MDDKYKDYLSYLEFLHRIGRRVGYKSDAESESMKMTREEQIKLTGLIMDKQLLGNFDRDFNHHDSFELREMMLNNNEQNRNEFVKSVQEDWINTFYKEIESLLEKITRATCEES